MEIVLILDSHSEGGGAVSTEPEISFSSSSSRKYFNSAFGSHSTLQKMGNKTSLHSKELTIEVLTKSIHRRRKAELPQII